MRSHSHADAGANVRSNLHANLHALLKRHGLRIFMDARLLLRGLKQRMSFAAARHGAEYVLIDHRRVPVGLTGDDLVRIHLARLHHVRDGLGYTKAP